MKFFSKTYVGLDFHDYSAQVVELRTVGDKIALEKYNRVLIPTDVVKNGEIVKEDELKVILKQLFEQANPEAIEMQDVAVILPSSKILSHVFSFPVNLCENEIRKALPYEIEKVIPFSIDDIYWDFTVLEKDEKSKSHASQKVFFACIKKDIVDKYTSVLESIGLTPALLGVQSEALRNIVQKDLLKNTNSLILDVGTLSINFLYLQEDTMKSFFSTNEGGYKLIGDLSREYQLTENALIEKKEKTMLNTAPQMESIKSFMVKNYEKARQILGTGKTDNIILTGEFLNLPGFYKLAKTYFPNQRVEIGDPKLALDINPAKFVPMNTSSDQEVSLPYSIYFVNAIGIARIAIQKSLGSTINLLPDRLKESFSNKRNVLFTTIASMLMTAISLFAATFLFFQYQNMHFVRLNMEIEKSAIDKVLYGTRYQEIRDEILAFNNEVNALSAIDNQLFSLPITIRQIKELLPKNVTITTIKFDNFDLAFEISGVSNTRADLLKLKANYENVDFIDEVIAPISNYDSKNKISFFMKLNLNFSKLNKYGSFTNTK